MKEADWDFSVTRLGRCTIPSPLQDVEFVHEEETVLYHSDLKVVEKMIREDKKPPAFEVAGPRQKLYFDASKLKCGLVTCGGLCPGLNDVIRAIIMSLHYHYGVQTVFGFRYGFEGLSSKYRHTPLELTPADVEDIHQKGGTILGSSRGPQDVGDMVDTLERMNVRILFTVGGDGTLRGAQALHDEIAKRDLKIAVVGVPKTIDNDISFVERSFGFDTAVAEAGVASYSAHVEALGAWNGVGLLKLMGRESGFIAAQASLANNEINFCLVPEVPIRLDLFLKALEDRLERRHHAVIVVGEGAGQDLMKKKNGHDASGNKKFGDIGLFLKEKIQAHFKKIGMEVNLKYIDPSYTIRSQPANQHDSVFCLLLGHNAVHAAMAGCTNMVVGYWKDSFTHVPIPLAISERKRIDPKGRFWSSVIGATGQPRDI